jgi:hypothetical protein
MAPEYVNHRRVSPKIDIFGFSVLVLEIVTRRSNCSSDDLGALNLLSYVSARAGFASTCISFSVKN